MARAAPLWPGSRPFGCLRGNRSLSTGGGTRRHLSTRPWRVPWPSRLPPQDPIVVNLDEPFLAREASAFGWSERRLAGLVSRGQLVRVERGVYAVTERWAAQSPQQRQLGLVRAAARLVPRALVSHRSAALLHGLPTPYGPQGAVRMTVSGDDRTSRGQSWVQLHRGETPAWHAAVQGGIGVTSVARTVVDCFREDGVPEGLAVGDAALRAGLVTVADVRLVRSRQKRWPGVTQAEAGIRLLDARRESWLESYSAGVMAARDVPLGTPQVVVLDEWGQFVARVDVAWADHGLVGEADGRGKYLGEVDDGLGRGEDAAAQRVVLAAQRESRLRELGLAVVRWDTHDVVRRPANVVARWHRAARAADPSRVRAALLCSCHRHPLTDCPQATATALLGR
jgi:Transcriptional regulator, AbiEi antitoxin